MKGFTRHELKQLVGIGKPVSDMNRDEVKGAQTALALIRAGVDFNSPEGKRLKVLAMDLRDRAIAITRLSLSRQGGYAAPVAGRIKTSLSWKVCSD